MKHLSTMPEPPSTLRPDLPRELDLVVTAGARQGSGGPLPERRGDGRRPRARRRGAAGRGGNRGLGDADRCGSRSATEAAATAATMIAPSAQPPRRRSRRRYYDDYEEPVRRATPIWPWSSRRSCSWSRPGWPAGTSGSSSPARRLAKPVTCRTYYGSTSRSPTTRSRRSAGSASSRSVKQGRDDTTAAGLVFKQDPDRGQAVDKGSQVTIWVSDRPPKVDVPDVRGQSRWTSGAGAEGRRPDSPGGAHRPRRQPPAR